MCPRPPLVRAAKLTRFGGQICDENRMRIDPTPASKRHHCGACATIAFSSEVDPGSREENASNKNLENEHRQLIERVNRLKADQEKRCDHEIIAEMHRRACNRRLLAARGNRAGTVTKRGAQRTTPSPGEIPAGDNDRKASAAAEVMRSSRTSSTGGLLFDASFVPVHVPWKILSPHNTTTMADIRVAAVNTLSMEATLIPLSASQPRQRSR